VRAGRQAVGDVNCDCNVDIGDSLVIMQDAVGLRDCETDPAFCNGCIDWDVNCDGSGDIGDALVILQKEAGLRDCTWDGFCVDVCSPVCSLPSGDMARLPPRPAREGAAAALAVDNIRRSASGRQYTFSVFVNPSGSALGGYVMELVYDPAAVAIAAIEGGSAPEFAEPPLSDETSFGAGRTRFAALNLHGLEAAEGRIHVATVTVRVLKPTAGGNDGLRLRPLSFKDTSGLPVTFEKDLFIGLSGMPGSPEVKDAAGERAARRKCESPK
jgi:hypothetical protein